MAVIYGTKGPDTKMGLVEMTLKKTPYSLTVVIRSLVVVVLTSLSSTIRRRELTPLRISQLLKILSMSLVASVVG